MTLTAPGCHLGGQIAGDVQSKLLALDEVEEANGVTTYIWNPNKANRKVRFQPYSVENSLSYRSLSD